MFENGFNFMLGVFAALLFMGLIGAIAQVLLYIAGLIWNRFFYKDMWNEKTSSFERSKLRRNLKSDDRKED